MLILLYIIIKQKERKREKNKKIKTTACPWDTLKITSLYLIYPKKLYIKVHIGTLRCTNVHLFEYKLQRCLYKGTIV